MTGYEPKVGAVKSPAPDTTGFEIKMATCMYEVAQI